MHAIAPVDPTALREKVGWHAADHPPRIVTHRRT